MAKQPRKRRLGRIFDNFYGAGVRGYHYDDPVFTKRSDTQHLTDAAEQIASGSAVSPMWQWHLQNSASVTKGMQFDVSGSTRIGTLLGQTQKQFTFACLAKPVSPAPLSQSLFCFAMSGSYPMMAWFGLVSGALNTVKPKFEIISGTVKHGVYGTAASINAWHTFGVSYTSGTSTRVCIATDASDVTGLRTKSALSASKPYKSTSFFMKRSGSANPPASGSAFKGSVNQAAIWTTPMTSSGFDSLYASASHGHPWSRSGADFLYLFGLRGSVARRVNYGTTGTGVTGSHIGTITYATSSVSV